MTECAVKWQRPAGSHNCAGNWQTLGWLNYELRVGGQQCQECPPNCGYLGPTPDIYSEYAIEPTANEPW